MIGIKLGSYNNEFNNVKLGPLKAIYYAYKEVIFVSVSSLKYLSSIILGNGDSSQKITRRLEKIKLNNELMEKKLMY